MGQPDIDNLEDPKSCPLYVIDSKSFEIQVTDRREGKPVSGATVVASNGSISPSYELHLKEDDLSPGIYKSNAVSGVYTLYVRKLGYQDVAIGSLNVESFPDNCGGAPIPVKSQKFEVTLSRS